MSTDTGQPAAGRRGWRWIAVCGEVVAVVAWVLLVLRNQYEARWLQPWDQAVLDGWVLLGVAGALIARTVARRSVVAGRLFLFRFGALVVATVMAVVGAEYVARFAFRNARSTGDVNDYIGHSHRWSPGPLNSLGFRDREIPPKKPGVYRIIVIGDSFTYGQGLTRAERFSNVLGRILGPRYQVFNFGIPGDNMPQHLTRLAQAIPEKPDFVLLQLYINDWETPQMRRPSPYPLLPPPLDQRLQATSLLYDMLVRQWWRFQVFTGMTESYIHYMDRNLENPNSPNSQEAFGQLREFFDRARKAGIHAGAVLFPETIVSARVDYPFLYLHRRVQRTCDAEHVTCLDLLSLYKQFRAPKDTWVNPFDAHPNAMVNRMAAYAILAKFGSQWDRLAAAARLAAEQHAAASTNARAPARHRPRH